MGRIVTARGASPPGQGFDAVAEALKPHALSLAWIASRRPPEVDDEQRERSWRPLLLCEAAAWADVPASARGGRHSLTGDEASSTTPRQGSAGAGRGVVAGREGGVPLCAGEGAARDVACPLHPRRGAEVPAHAACGGIDREHVRAVEREDGGRRAIGDGGQRRAERLARREVKEAERAVCSARGQRASVPADREREHGAAVGDELG